VELRPDGVERIGLGPENQGDRVATSWWAVRARKYVGITGKQLRRAGAWLATRHRYDYEGDEAERMGH